MSGSRRGRSLTALAVGAAVVLASVLVLPATPAGASDGGGKVLARGAAPDHGGPGEIASAVTGLAATPSGGGYWVLTADGAVRAYGDALFMGSAVGDHLNAVDLAAHPSGKGYWLVTDDGRVRTYGYARDLGSLEGRHLAAPIVAIAATTSGDGYWLVARDGGVVAFGDARYLGATAGTAKAPVAGIAVSPDGRGYWIAGTDGSVSAFGSAVAAGDAAGSLSSPVVAIDASPLPGGYWLATADGHVRAFGSAHDFGSAQVDAPVADLAARPLGDGYWLATGATPRFQAQSASQAVPYEPPAPVPSSGDPSDADFDRLAQCESGGRWNLRSGNGYYGGLQFSASTWQSHGGTGLPSDHTRAEQIDIGRRQWRQSRWTAWPSCSRQLGLR
jgi:hypothetical protein